MAIGRLSLSGLSLITVFFGILGITFVHMNGVMDSAHLFSLGEPYSGAFLLCLTVLAFLRVFVLHDIVMERIVAKGWNRYVLAPIILMQSSGMVGLALLHLLGLTDALILMVQDGWEARGLFLFACTVFSIITVSCWNPLRRNSMGIIHPANNRLDVA